MSATEQKSVPLGNAEAIEAWDGPLFDRFVQYRHIVVAGLTRYGEEAMRLHPPAVGAHVLDVGCGFGDTTRELAARAGEDGSVLGVDASPRFIAAARHEALQSSTPNVRFEVADVETSAFSDQFDLAFSRFGTMFFANPAAALRNVRRSLVPGGRLVMVVWRAKMENDWLYRAQTITERFVAKPEEYDAPTCGPGPFSMADADTTSGILKRAGFEEITLRRCDLPITIGRDIDEAVKVVMDLGPAGEILRLAADRAAHLHKPVPDALREGLADWARPMASSPPPQHGSSPPSPPRATTTRTNGFTYQRRPEPSREQPNGRRYRAARLARLLSDRAPPADADGPPVTGSLAGH